MKHAALALLAVAVIPLCGCASDEPASSTTTTTEETVQPAPVSTTTTTQQSTVQPMAPQ
jgi:hypothetical protein